MPNKFRVATFDIECTSLDAVGAGVVLCAVIKPLGEEPKVLRYDKMHLPVGNDSRLVRAILNELSQYEMLVGHNIERFDWNFLKTRAMIHGIPIIKNPLGYDTMKAFKRLGYLTVPNFRGKPSAGLAMVVDMYGFTQEKTALYPRHHWITMWGNKIERKKAMDALVDHCDRDVRMNEQIFERLFGADSNVTLKRLK